MQTPRYCQTKIRFGRPGKEGREGIPPKRAASFGVILETAHAVPKMDLLTRQEALIVFPEYLLCLLSSK